MWHFSKKIDLKTKLLYRYSMPLNNQRKDLGEEYGASTNFGALQTTGVGQADKGF
jgi:hypothetical protein